MTEYSENAAAINATGASIAALSVDSPERSDAVRKNLRLPFPILCDTKRVVVRQWDIYNAADMGGIAVPTVFVLGTDRRIQYRSVDSTRERVSAARVVRFLQGKAALDTDARSTVRAGLGDRAGPDKCAAARSSATAGIAFRCQAKRENIFVASANVKDSNSCALLKRERHLQRIFVALVRQMHRAIDVLQ